MKRKAKGGGRILFFFSGSPKDAGQCEKKRMAWRGLERQGKKLSLYMGRERENGVHAETLPQGGAGSIRKLVWSSVEVEWKVVAKGEVLLHRSWSMLLIELKEG